MTDALRSFKLTLAYDGAAYSGWQIQKNSPTIQAELEQAISRITGQTVRVAAAGRTDAGVHALGQVAGFKADTDMAAERIKGALNAVLPEDIRIIDCREAERDFQARFQALRKCYRYHVWEGAAPPLFGRGHVWAVKRLPPRESMEAALKRLEGEHDFAAFQSTGSQVKTTVRQMFRAELEVRGKLHTFSFQADGFLRHMVRALVGTLVSHDGSANIGNIIKSRDRSLAGRTAPPQGLFLAWVTYPGQGEPHAAVGPFDRFD